MNAELEKKYLAMQANPAPLIFSQVPDAEISSVNEYPDSNGADGDEDDFQINIPITPGNQSTSAAAGSTTGYNLLEPPELGEDEDLDAPIPPQGESAQRQPESPPKSSSEGEGENVAHSVATGGDALLDIAMEEEKEIRKRQKHRRVAGPILTAGGGLIIFCPYGCRVEVKEQHRGMTGKCPRCGAPFIVPVDPPQYKKPAAATSESAPSTAANRFKSWVTDLHLHIVDPEKLKIKADSLLKDFVEADFGFSADHLVVAVLSKKGGGGLFAKGGDKKETVRENMLAHLSEDKPIDELPVGEKFVFTAEEVKQIRVVQPTANRAASLFHGIPVFGTGRIAIQLPLTEKMPNPTYVSMGITEFWKFAQAMEEVYGISGLGSLEGLPTEPKLAVGKCHFSDMLVKYLEDVELFQADPAAQLEVVAYQCGACKTIVSEPARKKENLGGKSPKGIAKAKCPKCSSKMGEHLLYALKQDVTEPSMNETPSS